MLTLDSLLAYNLIALACSTIQGTREVAAEILPWFLFAKSVYLPARISGCSSSFSSAFLETSNLRPNFNVGSFPSRAIWYASALPIFRSLAASSTVIVSDSLSTVVTSRVDKIPSKCYIII